MVAFVSHLQRLCGRIPSFPTDFFRMRGVLQFLSGVLLHMEGQGGVWRLETLFQEISILQHIMFDDIPAEDGLSSLV